METITKGKTLTDLITISIATIVLTLAVWLPHLLQTNLFNLNFSQGFNTIYRNFDGLEYIVIAKSFYYPDQVAKLPQDMPAGYYASHFPGYSLAILGLAPLFGFLKSMLLVSVLATIAAACTFYLLVRDFKLSEHPLWLSLLFLILPARWLIVHSVGSSEPLFIFLIIATLYAFMKYELHHQTNWIILAGITGALAQLTRPPAALLFIALGLYILWQHRLNITKWFNYLPILLMPLTLLGIFYWYQQSYGDFWAYFHSGDNIHLTFPPFQVFDKQQFWVGDIWLEDIIYILGIGFFGGLTLWKKKLFPLAFFVLTYFTASSFVAHRDISRYTLPAAPFVLIAFEQLLTSKQFKIAAAIIALAIYLYTQNFILSNTAPYPNPILFDQ